MCGIAGILRFDGQPVETGALKGMQDRLAHRGPDGHGHWQEHNTCSVALIHTRLAILDLSEAGAQPMSNEHGDIHLVCNGEIYNFQELKSELEACGHQFSSRSDSEVLLHLYEEEGEAMLSRINGMFAFIIWDSRQQKMFIARDRMGLKPLYYTKDGDGTIRMASELRALLGDDRRYPLDREAIAEFLALRLIAAPRTPFRGIRKLGPGEAMSISAHGDIHHWRYWQPPVSDPALRWDTAYRERVEEALSDAVKRQLVSDVPLGLFLSGGMDSSTLLAMMSRHGGGAVCYCVCYPESGPHNEVVYARSVARHFGAELHEVEVDVSDYLRLMPEVVSIMEEPLADPTLVAFLQLSRQAREKLTVALAGTGGDEVFTGYGVYREARLRRILQRIPKPVWRGLSRILKAGPRFPGSNFLMRGWQPVADGYLGASHVYGGYEPDEIAGLWGEQKTAQATIAACLDGCSSHDPLELMQWVDLRTWLAESHLLLADKLAMSTALEIRAPLLDHELLELVWRLPPAVRLPPGDRLKPLLHEIIDARLPANVGQRGKRGFSTPIEGWLRGPMRKWADEILHDDCLRQLGLQPEFILQQWREHLAGQKDHGADLWTIITLGLWFQAFGTHVEGAGER